MEIFDVHCVDCLAVKSFDVFDLAADASALHNCFFDLRIAEKGLFAEFFSFFLEHYQAGVFFPDGEMFLLGVESEIVYFVQTVKYFLFLQELLKLHELYFSVEVFCQSSF